MSTVPATTVKELRDLTGAGMMDCKRALEEADGDLEQATQLLRERGIAAAQKRAGREAKEGKVLARIADSRAAMVAVGCETEPVSKNDEFLAFVQSLLEAVEAGGPEAVENLEDERTQLIAKIGENVVVRGAARVEAAAGEVVSAYVHRPAEKIGVVVRAKADPELARLLAMHISFANPRYTTRDEVPADEVERERAIYEKLPEVGAKPEHIRPQIIEGMLAKRFFAESVLTDEPWIHDDSKTVGQVLAESGAEVREFVRFSLAE
ncbi:MAG TPA: translation elongation factor Ts [Gaiellaceae bacterium]|nr:translation elongation factor Ts [Gaiellaceae bacterium]